MALARIAAGDASCARLCHPPHVGLVSFHGRAPQLVGGRSVCVSLCAPSRASGVLGVGYQAGTHPRWVARLLRIRPWRSAMGKRRRQAGEDIRPVHRFAGRRTAERHAGAAAFGAEELKALLWAVAITSGEAVVRRAVPSRSSAWLIAYSLLAGAAFTDTAPPRPRRGRASLWLG